MILYIHGFGSSGCGGKAEILKTVCAEQGIPFLAPTLSGIPELAIETLEQCISLVQPEPILLIGSSLGGFYGRYLAERYTLPAVLINPALDPIPLLLPYCGTVEHYYDGSPWIWTEKMCQSLHQFVLPRFQWNSTYHVLLETGDDTLFWKDTMMQLIEKPWVYIHIIRGGSHAFDSLHQFLPRILQWHSVAME